MYICRIKACGLIARPTLKLHWGCMPPELLTYVLHPTWAAPALIQTFCAIPASSVVAFFTFDNPEHFKNKKNTGHFQKISWDGFKGHAISSQLRKSCFCFLKLNCTFFFNSTVRSVNGVALGVGCIPAFFHTTSKARKLETKHQIFKP